ncbi:hypothetical protein LUZ63_001571 [Rhynchospora breviuscula]|uniref:ATP synthase subunit e, mitochondrial n=1 Tax=Rhynchospora breviuscula TaxID=2022672 RepID=A0A9Q0CX59_9POAL|nr:hypothetical protein LUZ63_001571 [Rhynchospora breviuscula]
MSVVAKRGRGYVDTSRLSSRVLISNTRSDASFSLSLHISRFLSLSPISFSDKMAGLPGPYSGVSTLAFVARASAFAFGAVYGSIKLSVLKSQKKAHEKAEAKSHH